MSLVLPHSIFIHIPKTGGSWVSTCLRNLGLAHGLDLPQRAARHFYSLDRPIFAFVRNPLTWYQSRWSDRFARLHWRGKLRNAPLIYQNKKELTDFCAWMWGILERQPGYVTQLYKDRLSPQVAIGRTENLTADLALFLNTYEPGFDHTVLATPPINQAGPGNRHYTLPLLKAVIDVEREAMEYFGYPTHTNYYAKINFI